MKHAYLILAHSSFGQLKRLLSLLDHPLNDIYVHIDKSSTGFCPEDFKDVCKHSALQFIPETVEVNWGGFSIVQAELILLRTALETGGYDFLHLLSGNDLPIKSQDYIHDFFRRNQGKEFVEFWNPAGHTFRRYRCRTFFPEKVGKHSVQHLNQITKFLSFYLGIRQNRDVDFKCGSQWFSITEAFAHYVLSKEDWIEKVFKYTTIPDEAVITTVLHSSPFAASCAGTNMRLIDFTRRESGHKHPHTFTMEDFAMLRSSDCLFARKFSESVDSEIIGRIEEVWPEFSLPE